MVEDALILVRRSVFYRLRGFLHYLDQISLSFQFAQRPVQHLSPIVSSTLSTIFAATSHT